MYRDFHFDITGCFVKVYWNLTWIIRAVSICCFLIELSWLHSFWPETTIMGLKRFIISWIASDRNMTDIPEVKLEPGKCLYRRRWRDWNDGTLFAASPGYYDCPLFFIRVVKYIQTLYSNRNTCFHGINLGVDCNLLMHFWWYPWTSG
jgi:hypothetical protein